MSIRTKKMSKPLFSFIVLCLSFFSVTGQETPIDPVRYFDENSRWYNEFTEHWFYFFDISNEDVRTSIKHWSEIGDDLKTNSNSSEGTYSNGGETHGDYLRWSEKRGFVWLKVNKCQGGPMKIIRGRVIRDGQSFRFKPTQVFGESKGHGNHGTQISEVEFFPVKWRKADYLIQKNSLANFADYTAGLNPETSGLFDEGWYFSKLFQDHKGSVNERPIFPRGYEKLVKAPIKTSILRVGKPYRRSKPLVRDDDGLEIDESHDDQITEVKIKGGKSVGIYPGVLIRFLNKPDDYRVDGVVVTKVFESYSIAEYITDIPKLNCKKSDFANCEPEEKRRLKVGLKLSTTGEW